MNIQGWFPLGLTCLISLHSEGLSRVFSSTTVWKHQFGWNQGCSSLALVMFRGGWFLLRGCPVHYNVQHRSCPLSTMWQYQSLNPSSLHTKKCLQHYQIFPGGQNCPQLRITGLKLSGLQLLIIPICPPTCLQVLISMKLHSRYLQH